MHRDPIQDPGEEAARLQAPADPVLRARLAAAAETLAASRDSSRPPGLEELTGLARRVLARIGAGEAFLGYAAVQVHNACWRDAFQAVPFSRRMLLLPRCLAGLGAALEGEPGLLAGLLDRARTLGYTIRVADGTPLAVRLLAEGQTEAILGISCLDSLDKAFAKVRLAGIPALAVPLHANGCRETATDLEQARRCLELAGPGGPQRPFPLLARVRALFSPAELERRLGPAAPEEGPLGALLAEPAALARAWLLGGGKRLRPFLAAAVHRALTGEEQPSEAVLLAALAVEAFHKASLVHDDIADDDELRYGAPTLHRGHGVGVALNVGDYLLGLGYRLLARAGALAGPEAGCALLALMAETHLRLAEGQGAELAWRRDGPGRLGPRDLVRIYALKTAPAFQAALGAGLVLGSGAAGAPWLEPFCRHLGVGFQIRNDLEGWQADLAGGRPTLLPLLAEGRAVPAGADAGLAGRLYTEWGVFERAAGLRDRCRARALEEARRAGPEELREVLELLVDLALPETGP